MGRFHTFVPRLSTTRAAGVRGQGVASPSSECQARAERTVTPHHAPSKTMPHDECKFATDLFKTHSSVTSGDTPALPCHAPPRCATLRHAPPRSATLHAPRRFAPPLSSERSTKSQQRLRVRGRGRRGVPKLKGCGERGGGVEGRLWALVLQ